MRGITIKVLNALCAAALLLPCVATASSQGARIVNTPHNLSISGGGGAHNVKATEEVRICVFCHTPHHAASEGPLWSRKSNLSIYVPYASTTIKANPQQPKGPSRLCLSCHDGAVAMGVLTGDYTVSSLGKIPADTNPALNANLGTDLSTSHPVSMTYGLSGELNDKGTLANKGISLSEDTYVECTSCHDPHNNQYGNFLVRDNSTEHDLLCRDCHNKTDWANADNTHRTGGLRYSSTVATQVGADGCRNCHRPHSAERGVHLLKQPTSLSGEESNCLGSCHSGASYNTVTGIDIATQISRAYSHKIQIYSGVHKEDETLPVTSDKKHVQCVDCHNPHRSGYQGSPLGDPNPAVTPASTAPYVNGPLRGVRGVDVYGNPLGGDGSARYEYEVCFRCHLGASASAFKTASLSRPVRAFSTYDEGQRFATGNPSYHPVAYDTVGRTGRSLLSSLQNSQFRIYCSDCHAPHGSDERYILQAQNVDTYPSAATSYPLCFKCHDQQYLLDPMNVPHSNSATMHQSHVRDHSAPCSACHDPHGVPGTLGANTTNGAHLVNFDTRYTGDAPAYNAPARSCTLAGTCHVGGGTRTY